MNEIKMEDLENLIKNLNVTQKDKTFLDYELNIRNYFLDNPLNFILLSNFFLETKEINFRYWILNILQEIIEKKYFILTLLEKDLFRNIICDFLQNKTREITLTPFISSKFSLLFFTWMEKDLFEGWTNLFKDYLQAIVEEKDEDSKNEKICKFKI